MTDYLDIDSVYLDSDALTQWSFDLADANNDLKKPLKQQAIVCADGSLLLIASNDGMQIALRVAKGKWQHLSDALQQQASA